MLYFEGHFALCRSVRVTWYTYKKKQEKNDEQKQNKLEHSIYENPLLYYGAYSHAFNPRILVSTSLLPYCHTKNL